MRYLLPYKIFESDTKDDWDNWDEKSVEDKKSTIFALYPPIPLEKRAAAVAIKKIRYAEDMKVSKLDDNKIYFPDKKPIDKLRWYQYFKQLTTSKEIRGHNSEGLIAGLYDGDFTRPGTRADLIIDDQYVSVKSLDSASEAPVLASIGDSLTDEQKGIIGNRSLIEVFTNETQDFKREIWDASFGGRNRVDYFFIFYFVEPSKKSSGTIFIHIIKNEEMFDFIKSGKNINSPKNKGNQYQLRVSSSYKSIVQNPTYIRIPRITEKDLDNIWNQTSRNWANYVFGKSISRKMRSDTIEDIIDDKSEISKRMGES